MPLSDEDAQALAEEFRIDDPAELQEQFSGWQWAYDYGKARDASLSPSNLRDELAGLARKARRLEEALGEADMKTCRALEDVSRRLLEAQSDKPYLDRLDKVGLLRRADPLPMTHADLQTMYAAVRFIAENAEVKAESIHTLITTPDDKGKTNKKPPRSYKTKPALYTLVINIRSYWEKAIGPYTREFDDYDEDADRPAQIPRNAAAKFTTECVQRIDQSINAPTIEKAMQECIAHQGSSYRRGEK